MTIRELMSTPAITCRASDTLTTAAQLLWEHDFGVVFVIDDAGTLVGAITDRDICMAAYTQGLPLHSIYVASAMAKRIFASSASDPVSTAAQLMRDKQVRRIPVVDGDHHPIGVLSLNDVARSTAAHGKSSIEHELVRTLAAISQHRSASLLAVRAPSVPALMARQLAAPSYN